MAQVRTPDGIPSGWELNFDHDTIILQKRKPERHWSALLSSWPKFRPSTVVFLTDFKHKVVFVCAGGGGRLLGIPFRDIEALYNEVSRL